MERAKIYISYDIYDKKQIERAKNIIKVLVNELGDMIEIYSYLSSNVDEDRVGEIEFSRIENYHIKRSDIIIADLSEHSERVSSTIAFASGWNKAWLDSRDFLDGYYYDIVDESRVRLLGYSTNTYNDKYLKGLILDDGRFINTSEERYHLEILKDIRSWLKQNRIDLYEQFKGVIK